MKGKVLPFTKEQIEKITEKHPTPFHIYDEKGIIEYAKRFNAAFSWNKGFKEFYAIKSAPNPFLMKILRAQGFGIDASSLAELELAGRVGMRGEEIMFTSNDTPAHEYVKARELGATINLDDISHIEYLEKHAGLPELISLRYNPGALKDGNVIIGNPEDSKYGFTREQLFEGYKMLKKKGVKRFGIHTMVASNELDSDYFIETAEILFDVIVEISKEVGIRFEFANLGGGIGIPYKNEHKPVDIEKVSAGIKDLYEKLIVANQLDPLKIFFESGRVITGPYGFLVSKVLHIKETYKKYAGLDSCMANLMRPALYGAYHHITVLGKENEPCSNLYDVTGSLCENNDKFAINRLLPKIEQGDIVVIHDTGAHGHAMGFNYNGKLRSAELLLRENGEVVEIRRAETMDDYFATLDFGKLKDF
ncbi:MAG: diaminopimelate decarboxylase [Bacteroidetes bacterium GWF2_42_66]|nr:MAG: diaminopimelate decarboxylase [Bacteroidetes bacterium GWA2_42_15]OFY02832.1 MAG: diaminopimelate decarboxylase [Bacteroidetes bacterium GWE2_42_39]OFY44486.1 MAG: diaminopimelate decarboxylase [Bacteroidetes bacterium GWF2_42_66]HBL74969.1 diaminopimelate decarboxylase [Prolixibacteraceae bacterium]HCU62282.1 diaminopimelate decarboxylase [Prolixibacteraceae bacterium]